MSAREEQSRWERVEEDAESIVISHKVFVRSKTPINKSRWRFGRKDALKEGGEGDGGGGAEGVVESSVARAKKRMKRSRVHR